MSFETSLSCVACGVSGKGMVTLHHVLTRKARPDLIHEPKNCAPVCQRCHNAWHMKGTSHMADKHPGVKRWLISNGWEFVSNKWRFFSSSDTPA